MVLRIEDTDRERSTPENVEQILDALRWLGLDWDEGPISQAERAERHRERSMSWWKPTRPTTHWQRPRRSRPTRSRRISASGVNPLRLIRREPRFDSGSPRARPSSPTKSVGTSAFDNSVQDDFVIARGDGSVLYNFAVAVDDADMGITHVIRGDDHLSNTPKQLLVMEALDVTPPRYAHLPLLHGSDGKKLSKRHGAASVQEVRDAGYLPAAVRNYLALLGWGTQDDTTIMSTDELIERFDIADVGRASAIFDEQKLRWLNGRFMREMDLDAYTEAVASHFGREPDERLRAACEIAQEKAQTLDEVWPLIGFLFEEPETDEKAWKKVMKDGALPLLSETLDALRGAEPFEPEELESSLGRILAEHDVKPGKLYQPIRVAITGTAVSPGIFESLAALGKERSVARIERAVQRLTTEAEKRSSR